MAKDIMSELDVDMNNMEPVRDSSEVKKHQLRGVEGGTKIPTDQEQVYGKTLDGASRSHRDGPGGRRPTRD